MQHINIKASFILTFCVLKTDSCKIHKMMQDNNYKYTTYYKSGLNNFIEFRVECTLKRAEATRLLLKNIKVYD